MGRKRVMEGNGAFSGCRQLAGMVGQPASDPIVNMGVPLSGTDLQVTARSVRSS